jgi:hypothetical protein
MKLKLKIAIISYAALCSMAGGQIPAAPAVDQNGLARASIALSPAIIMVRGKLGQSTTQTLTIVNHTSDEVRFNLSTLDGKRSFSPAGRIHQPDFRNRRQRLGGDRHGYQHLPPSRIGRSRSRPRLGARSIAAKKEPSARRTDGTRLGAKAIYSASYSINLA